MVELGKKQEADRLESLTRDRQGFEGRMLDSYGEDWRERRAQHAKESESLYDNQLFKIGGGCVFALVVINLIADGFLAGGLSVIALAIAGFAWFDHGQKRPDFKSEADIRPTIERDEEISLDIRERHPDQDRKRWVLEHGNDDVEPVVATEPEPWRVRPIEEDDGITPAFILTLLFAKKDGSETNDEEARIKKLRRIRVERRDIGGTLQTIEDRVYENWPISWSWEQVEGMARDAGYLCFGQDSFTVEDPS